MPPINYGDRCCAEVITNAIVQPNGDDGIGFWRNLRNK